MSAGALSIPRSDRHNELEPHPVLAIRRCGKLAGMILNNHAADRQAQSHSMCLRRYKRRKYVVQLFRINSRS